MYCFLMNRGEFSLASTLAFERKLERIRKFKTICLPSEIRAYSKNQVITDKVLRFI